MRKPVRQQQARGSGEPSAGEVPWRSKAVSAAALVAAPVAGRCLKKSGAHANPYPA